MNRNCILVLVCVLVLAAAAVGYFTLRPEGISVERYTSADRPPRIRPDYVGTVIPPNIAPLNFCVEEPGTAYCVTVRSARGTGFEVVSRTGRIDIPLGRWRELLRENKGNPLFFDVYVRAEDGNWTRYKTIGNRIAREEIDGYLAYRLLKPLYNFWRKIGIYQRDLASWDESVVLHGKSFGNGCVNCHTFRNNRPDGMFVGIRGSYGSATLLAADGKVDKIGAKWGYTAWHPGGRVAAYNLLKLRPVFHRAGMEVRDLIEMDAALLYYDLKKQALKTVPGIADRERVETYPTWSPDGRYLYFCSARILWKDRDAVPPERFDEVKYDLRRIGYDVETDTWGKVETVLSARKTGLSILMPRISPDGRFLLFCMCNYGCAPVHQPSCDLYMMDLPDGLKTGRYRRLSINSRYAESWHSWSTNSRWIVFSSKRRGGLFTRLFISYVDAEGEAHKPFILPQRDPASYDAFLMTYSVPELITGPIPFSQRALAGAARSPNTISPANPIVTGATPMAPGRRGADPYRRQ